MHGFLHRFATLNSPFIAKELRKLADEVDRLFPGPPFFAVPLIFTTKGTTTMGDITVKDTDAAFGGTVTFLDAKGDQTSPDDVPQWSVDNADAISIVAADDGLSAQLTPGNPGAAIVTVTSTDTDGTVVTSQGTVTVQSGEAVIGDVEFTPAA